MQGTINNQSSTNQTLLRSSALAFLMMPLCYVAMFVFFFVILDIPHGSRLIEKIDYMAEQKALISFAYFIGYIVFGCLLLIGVEGINARLQVDKSELAKFAYAFGMLWFVLMMCSGMIAMVGMETMARLFEKASEHTETVYFIAIITVDALGGGIEFAGGMWVLLISITALRQQQLSTGLNVLGLFCGVFGIATLILSIPEFKDAFGLSQVVWFIWMGFVLMPRRARV